MFEKYIVEKVKRIMPNGVILTMVKEKQDTCDVALCVVP